MTTEFLEPPLRPWDIRFPRLIGLDEMAEFTANALFSALGKLTRHMTIAEALVARGVGDQPYSANEAAAVFKAIDFFRAQCEEIELSDPVHQGALAKTRLAKATPFTPSLFAPECRAIIDAFERELWSHRFAYVPKERVDTLVNVSIHWGPIWKKFGSVEKDSRDAVACLAWDMHTACVFHCMLALEPGLKALAGKLRIRSKAKDWGSIIGKIETEIANRRSTAAASKTRVSSAAAKRRAALLTFCSDAATEFAYFKDAWRNHTAHGRKRYDEYEARRILDHVRQFMVHLSTQLREVK